jgi:MGT family glycosyltransferase
VARIGLVNAPFHSHVAAMMRLADVLVRQDHELIVWAPEDWREAVGELGGRFELSAPEIPRVSVKRRAAEFAGTTERESERLIPELHAHDLDILIRDSQTPWALVAGTYLGIPTIVSHPMFPLLEPDDDDEMGIGMAGGDAAERERFERSRRSIARRWGVELADVRGLHHRTSEPTLVFTTEEIVGDRELPPAWRCVGPLLSEPPDPRPDRHPSLVYACFGTARNRRTDLFRLVVAAAKDQPLRFLISAGGRTLSFDDLGSLPPNVEVREFAPSREVLARASVHITHGGCNSVHESLVAGVPMVCLPQAFDQIPLSQRVEQLGAGVIAGEDPEAIAHAVREVHDDAEARMRVGALADRLKQYDGEARVAAVIAERL